jgi:hypothetical protein
MYPTSKGERILLGGERRLFEESLAMMVDHLSVCDGDFGVPAFDQLQLGQKLFTLYRAGRALLIPDEPPPEITAFLEAAVATVYQHVFDMVIQEIDEPEFTPRPSWRQLAIEAASQSESIDQVPKETSRNKEEWEIIVECLADDVVGDRDFELQVHLDADPDKSHDVKEMMGISEDYYTAIAHEPPDHQLNLYIDALKGLTPRGRGEYFEGDGDSDLPGNELF